MTVLMVARPRRPVTEQGRALLLPLRGRARKEEGAIWRVECLPPLSPRGRPVPFCCHVLCGWVGVVGEGLGEWWQGWESGRI